MDDYKNFLERMGSFDMDLSSDSDSELKHYGVMGMKWGVRRYQNKDGSLTPLGKKHFSGVSSDKLAGEINKKVQDDLRSNTNAARSASEMTGQIARANSSVQSIRQKKATNKINLDNMTDKELQSKINRMNMERQYKALKAEEVGSGQRYINDVLTIGGSALATTASALSIALAIKQLTS